MSENKSKSGGIGFIGLLTVAFIVLKLTGHIGWSWIWVLSSMWIPISAMLIISMLTICAAGVAVFIENKNK